MTVLTIADLIVRLSQLPADTPVLLPAPIAGSGYSPIRSVDTQQLLQLNGRPRGEGWYASPNTARDDAASSEDIEVVGDEITAVTLLSEE